MTATPPPSEPTNAIHEFEEMTLEPESMNVGQLNHIVRRLRERIYQDALKHQSALASQEARHQKALIAKDAEWIDRARRYFDIGSDAEIAKVLDERYAPGSVPADVVMHEVWKRNPDVEALAAQVHRLQDAEARHRQEMEEAKRGCGRFVLEERKEYVERAKAAEQREREAGGKLESLTGAMTSAASAVQGCIADHAMRCRVDACHDHQMFRNLKAAIGILDSALAFIRSAPSPVLETSAYCQCGNPSLVGWWHFGRHTGSPCAPMAAPALVSAPPTETIQERYARMAKSSEFKRAYEGQSLGERIPIDGASPVEPGSDPQEPETR